VLAAPAPAPDPAPDANLAAALDALHPGNNDDFDEPPTAQKSQPRIPDAIDAVDAEPGQLDSKPSISWS
jgi:hypothetical protein